MVSAIEKGFPQREIQNAAYDAQLKQERGDQKVVGVNFQREEETGAPPELLRVDPRIEREQCKRLEQLRARRDNTAVTEALDAVQQAASGTENLMPHILHAVEQRATLGEVSDAMRAVFGEYRERVFI